MAAFEANVAEGRSGRWWSLCLPVLLTLAVGPAAAGEGFRLELNKLEPQGAACRVYLVAEAGRDLRSLELDLVLFGRDGVIARRLAVELGPLRAAKRSVKLFDLADTGCDTIGSILVNEVMACETAAGPVADCTGRLELASRAGIELIK